MDILLLVGKILFGGYFLYSGVMHFKNLKMLEGYAASKGIPMASFAVSLTGLMMVLGGLGVIFDQYVQISLGLIAVFLLVVSFTMHAFWKETDPMKKMPEMVNFTKNIALLGAALILIAL